MKRRTDPDMKPAEAPGTWSWPRVGADALLVASCPMMLDPGQAVVPAREAAFDQELLGFGGQLRLFERLLARMGRTLHLVAAPEIFATDESFRHFARLAGRPKAPANIVHFRFGMTSAARLLKRAANIMVCAESHVWRTLTHDLHPFADGRTLPELVTDNPGPAGASWSPGTWRSPAAPSLTSLEKSHGCGSRRTTARQSWCFLSTPPARPRPACAR